MRLECVTQKITFHIMTLTNTTTYFKLFAASIGLATLISCGTDDTNYETPITETDEEAFERNEAEILAYIEANELEATRTDSGLYYVIETEGTGETPSSSANVTVTYKGYFLNDSVFDQAVNPIEFNLANVIAGFREGISLMKEGGTATLLMPAKLAYGASGAGPIPPNTALVFDIELIATE